MPTVMIVDDDAAIRGVLRDLLTDEGFEIIEAEAGSAVIDALASDTPPDLIMMDVRMPDKSGIEILREIRQPEDGPLPIIMMTAFGTSSVAIQAMQAGGLRLSHQAVRTRRRDAHGTPVLRPQEALRPGRGALVATRQAGSERPADRQQPRHAEVYKTIGRVAARTRRCSSPARPAPARS